MARRPGQRQNKRRTGNSCAPKIAGESRSEQDLEPGAAYTGHQRLRPRRRSRQRPRRAPRNRPQLSRPADRRNSFPRRGFPRVRRFRVVARQICFLNLPGRRLAHRHPRLPAAHGAPLLDLRSPRWPGEEAEPISRAAASGCRNGRKLPRYIPEASLSTNTAWTSARSIGCKPE